MSARARRTREAVTRILRAEHLNPALTLVQVAIHTGRTHQIRVHLSAIGHPIVGDALYGGVHRRVPGDIRAVTHLERPFLHAAKLAFMHPVEHRRMEFTSPLPADLQRVLDELRGTSRGEPEIFRGFSGDVIAAQAGRGRRVGPAALPAPGPSAFLPLASPGCRSVDTGSSASASTSSIVDTR